MPQDLAVLFGNWRLFLPLAAGSSPTLLRYLARAAYGKGVGGDVLGDARRGADVGPVSDADRRYQRGVAANEDAFADARLMLVDAIVVTEDGAGADIAARADLRIAEIGKVVGLGAFGEPGF